MGMRRELLALDKRRPRHFQQVHLTLIVLNLRSWVMSGLFRFTAKTAVTSRSL